MVVRVLLLIALNFICLTNLFAQEIKNSSYVNKNGDRVLKHEAIVNGPIDQVWAAFTTTEGLKSFAAPVASIELKIGGKWEASYDKNKKIGDPGNIINEVISYLPMEMLSIKIAQTPPGFPHPELGKQLWTVIQFEEVGKNQTKVKCTMLGWGTGKDWDEVYKLFERGNEIVMKELFTLFNKESLK